MKWVVVCISAVLSAGCDPEGEEHELSDLEDVAEVDEPGRAVSADPAEDSGISRTTFQLSEPSQAAGSGGISPSAKRCCVSCSDKWTGWWDLGTSNDPKCNTRGPKWCHDHNWDFNNAEWFYTCPTG